MLEEIIGASPDACGKQKSSRGILFREVKPAHTRNSDQLLKSEPFEGVVLGTADSATLTSYAAKDLFGLYSNRRSSADYVVEQPASFAGNHNRIILPNNVSWKGAQEE